jgi:hypothetical protein
MNVSACSAVRETTTAEVVWFVVEPIGTPGHMARHPMELNLRSSLPTIWKLRTSHSGAHHLRNGQHLFTGCLPCERSQYVGVSTAANRGNSCIRIALFGDCLSYGDRSIVMQLVQRLTRTDALEPCVHTNSNRTISPHSF